MPETIGSKQSRDAEFRQWMRVNNIPTVAAACRILGVASQTIYGSIEGKARNKMPRARMMLYSMGVRNIPEWESAPIDWELLHTEVGPQSTQPRCMVLMRG